MQEETRETVLEDFNETLGYRQDMFEQVAWRLARTDAKMINKTRK